MERKECLDSEGMPVERKGRAVEAQPEKLNCGSEVSRTSLFRSRLRLLIFPLSHDAALLMFANAEEGLKQNDGGLIFSPG